MSSADDRLERQIRFLLEAQRLNQVLRHSVVGDSPRRENAAEHSWQVALMAVVLVEHAGEEVDLSRVVAMLVVHDVVEVDAGDTFVYDTDAKRDQAKRERAAADRLFALLPEPTGGQLRALWDEFEDASTAEARFAKAIDRFQPVLTNWSGDGAGWRKHAIDADDVLRINQPIAVGAPSLWQRVKAMVAEARSSGSL